MILAASTPSNYTVFQKILRAVANVLQIPVIIILIAMIAFAVFCIGWIIVEAVRERRHMDANLPLLLDELKSGEKPLDQCIIDSGLLYRQKKLLLSIMAHPSFDDEERQSFADNLLEAEEKHYDSIVKWTDTMAKLAPMAGLLGTLIPLGPGIIALGQGDTYTLSQSMLTAFDTTIAGLVVAGICIVISTLRKKWYSSYMSDLETLVDFVVKAEDSHGAQ